MLGSAYDNTLKGKYMFVLLTSLAQWGNVLNTLFSCCRLIQSSTNTSPKKDTKNVVYCGIKLPMKQIHGIIYVRYFDSNLCAKTEQHK